MKQIKQFAWALSSLLIVAAVGHASEADLAIPNLDVHGSFKIGEIVISAGAVTRTIDRKPAARSNRSSRMNRSLVVAANTSVSPSLVGMTPTLATRRAKPAGAPPSAKRATRNGGRG